MRPNFGADATRFTTEDTLSFSTNRGPEPPSMRAPAVVSQPLTRGQEPRLGETRRESFVIHIVPNQLQMRSFKPSKQKNSSNPVVLGGGVGLVLLTSESNTIPLSIMVTIALAGTKCQLILQIKPTRASDTQI